MFNNFGSSISAIFKEAEKERYLLHHPYVGTEHLLLAILKCDDDIALFFQKYNLTYQKFRKELINVVGSSQETLDINLWTPLLKRVVESALENAKENNNGIVTTKDLILALFEEGEGIGIRLLIGMNIDIDSLYEEINQNKKGSNQKLSLLEIGTVLNDTVLDDEMIINRDREIEAIIETLLRKKKNNPILIGEAGVGKTAIVEELARRINKKDVPEKLINTKIVSLEMSELVSGTKYRGEFEEKLTKIVKELENNDNYIIFIDEIHSMVKAGGAEGAITAGDILKPALARGKIKCIGATTKDEYLKYFYPDKALMRRFEVVNVLEPNYTETKEILLKVKSEYEKHHNVCISDNIIDSILNVTENFIHNKKNPDKAIDFLDSVCSRTRAKSNYTEFKKASYKRLLELKEVKDGYIKNKDYEKALDIYNKELIIKEEIHRHENKEEIIIEEDVLETLENKTNIIFNKQKLKFLDETTFNDEFANRIIKLIKKQLYNHKCFLRIYINGNNKEKLIKDIANLFPKVNYIGIDLKEYSSSIDISKLIGTTQGYIGYNDNHILNSLNNNLFSIIHFDNYNYAHSSIKELIKEILKEGHIKDNKGNTIYFNNSFIFISDEESKNPIGFESVSINSNELKNLVDEVLEVYNNKALV